MSVSNRQLIGIMAESGSYGNSYFTGSAPTQYFAASNISIKPQITTIENEDITSNFSGRKSLSFGKACDVSMDFRLTGRTGSIGGPAASEMYWSPFLYAAGFERTLVDATVDYFEWNPVGSSTVGTYPAASSMTIVNYMIRDDDKTKSVKSVARGVRGNVTLNFAIDQVAKGTFTGRGLYYSEPTANTTTPTLPAEYSGELDPWICKGATFTIGGTSYCVESLDVSTNWAVNDDNCMTSDGAVGEVFLSRGTGARMGGSMTLKGGSDTLYTILPAIEAGTEFSVVYSLSSSLNGEFEMSMPKMQFVQYDKSENGSRFNYNLTFSLNGEWNGALEKGDNELFIRMK